ncbi:MAG: ABC transporter permease [Candidatus Bathyarchaeota archaeon]|nr:MAG: ABC transporter permease [Candidatus Bathyarchaeota archaeon]
MVSVIIEGLARALDLIVSGDKILIDIAIRTVSVSGLATLLASCWSIPLGVAIGLGRFRGRLILRGLFNALLGVPAVTVGLVFYLMLTRTGPLGFLQLLFTPVAIVIGQSVLITPIIVSFVAGTLESADPEIKSLALTMGASKARANLTVLSESLSGVILAVTASFNRAISELGVALMLGGNIRGHTRVLTTTIALETGKANIELGIALTVILMVIVGGISLLVNVVQRRL